MRSLCQRRLVVSIIVLLSLFGAATISAQYDCPPNNACKQPAVYKCMGACQGIGFDNCSSMGNLSYLYTSTTDLAKPGPYKSVSSTWVGCWNYIPCGPVTTGGTACAISLYDYRCQGSLPSNSCTSCVGGKSQLNEIISYTCSNTGG
jgi:hypothetical protein